MERSEIIEIMAEAFKSFEGRGDDYQVMERILDELEKTVQMTSVPSSELDSFFQWILHGSPKIKKISEDNTPDMENWYL